MAGSTIQAHSHFDGLAADKSDLLIGTPSESKGYQLMKAMGFKDRGANKFCFKSYDQSDSEEDDWQGADPLEL